MLFDEEPDDDSPHVMINRHGKEMRLHLLLPENLEEKPRGVLVLLHGHGGAIGYRHNMTVAEGHQRLNYIVVGIDATGPKDEGNDLNLSDSAETCDDPHQQHIENLEDGVAEIRKLLDHKGPIALAGHSLAGHSIVDYAINHPDEVEYCFVYSGIDLGAHKARAGEIKAKIHLIVGSEDTDCVMSARSFRKSLPAEAQGEHITIEGAVHNFADHLPLLGEAVMKCNTPSEAAPAAHPELVDDRGLSL